MIYRFIAFPILFACISGCTEATESGVDASMRDSSVGTADAGTIDVDAGEHQADASLVDAGAAHEDAGEHQADAGSSDGLDGGAPIACSFNSDCPSDRRCECDEAAGCWCLPGVRGTGQNGVDMCTTGNECASALCIEGPGPSGTHYCSAECESDDDCGGNLPVCRDIVFVGRVCIRAPEA